MTVRARTFDDEEQVRQKISIQPSVFQSGLETAPSIANRSSPYSHRPTTPWKHREAIVNGVRLHYVQAEPSVHLLSQSFGNQNTLAPSRQPTSSSELHEISSRDDSSTMTQLSPPLLLLLHGFPEFYLSWRHQITAFVAGGYRVVAPDLRGFNLSEKPVSGYTVNTLAEDIRQLILHVHGVATDRPVLSQGGIKAQDAICLRSHVYLMGHDWGSVIACAVASMYPNLVSKIILVESTHLAALERARLRGRTVPPCRITSIGGILRFCPPVIPELLLGYNRSWLLSSMFFPTTRGSSDEHHRTPSDSPTDSICCSSPTGAPTPSAAEMEEELYRDAMSQPGAVTSMLAYFRSLNTSLRQCRVQEEIRCPTLVVWGTDTDSETDSDAALARSHVDCLQEMCDQPVELFLVRRSRPPASRHRLARIHHEEPAEVNRCVLQFLRSHGHERKDNIDHKLEGRSEG